MGSAGLGIPRGPIGRPDGHGPRAEENGHAAQHIGHAHAHDQAVVDESTAIAALDHVMNNETRTNNGCQGCYLWDEGQRLLEGRKVILGQEAGCKLL